MKNITRIMRSAFIIAYILVTVALVGCAPKQDVIHSNSVYQPVNVSSIDERIFEVKTPLAAPRVTTESAAETVTLVCEFQAN